MSIDDLIGGEIRPLKRAEGAELLDEQISGAMQPLDVATPGVERGQGDELEQHRTPPSLEIGDEVIGSIHPRSLTRVHPDARSSADQDRAQLEIAELPRSPPGAKRNPLVPKTPLGPPSSERPIVAPPEAHEAAE